jgi:hypothetical protein
VVEIFSYLMESFVSKVVQVSFVPISNQME